MTSPALQDLKAWFAASPFAYRRRRTRVVMVGKVALGGNQPVRVQTMTTTDTLDTRKTVDQVLRCVDAGSEIVRITAPSMKEARNLEAIKAELTKRGIDTPLVADIHFTPDAAMEAALHVEKVRVNPGNFADSKTFRVKEYSDEQYAGELNRIEDRFAPLVLRCKELKRAMRIGTNHGSLSDRVMNRYGDSPLGMVESALEFVRIARKYDYHDLVLSMKSSNPKVMVQAYRLLAARMEEEGMDYPFHLGVTEAGEGEDGRVKSSVGIATLLEDGIGDTLRVSLTEDPELEIPVAYRLANRYPEKPVSCNLFSEGDWAGLEAAWKGERGIDEYRRRGGGACRLGGLELGAAQPVRVFTPSPYPASEAQKNLAYIASYPAAHPNTQARPEVLLFSVVSEEGLRGANHFVHQSRDLHVPSVARFNLQDAWSMAPRAESEMVGLRLPLGPLSADTRERFGSLAGELDRMGKALLLEFPQGMARPLLEGVAQVLDAAEAAGASRLLLCLRGFLPSQMIHLNRALSALLRGRAKDHPVMLAYDSEEAGDDLLISTSTLFGSLLADGMGDAVMLEHEDPSLDTVALCFNALQAAQVRVSKTEFISCPSCGRTLFELQEVTARIKRRTSHLTGLKIAIMGCIVNGPGEMADADFGYVGGQPGKVNLFVGKECVQRHIPFDHADDALVELIKKHGKWKDPD